MSSSRRITDSLSWASSKKGLRETQEASDLAGESLAHNVAAVWGPLMADQSTQLAISSRQSSRQSLVSWILASHGLSCNKHAAARKVSGGQEAAARTGTPNPRTIPPLAQ